MNPLALVTKFLPGLTGALGAFLNPWVLLAIVAASSSSFLYALHLGEERREDVQAKYEAIENSRKVVVRYVVTQQKVIDEELTNELKRKIDHLSRDNAALLDSLSRHIQAGRTLDFSRDVSQASCGGPGTDGVCVSRSKLAAGLRTSLQRFVGRHLPSLGRGDIALTLLESCVGFTEKQHALTSGVATEQPQ